MVEDWAPGGGGSRKIILAESGTCLVVNPGWGMQITSFIKFSFPGDAFPQLSTDPISRGMVSVAADGSSCQGSRGEGKWKFSGSASPRPRSLPGPAQRWVQPSLTWPCFRDAMLAYRGTQARLALVFATASETAPMAMLPWRMGSGGSGGIMGFSKRVSLRPGEENIETEDSFLEASQ